MRTVLLDVDGTLVNSSRPILGALNTALTDLGLAEMEEADLWKHVGPPLQQTLDSLLRSRGDDLSLLPRLMDDYRQAYQPMSLELAATYPGVRKMLASLDGRFRLGVVTSKPRPYAEPILVRLGFAEMMEVIEGPDVSLETEPKAVTLARALSGMAIDDPSTAVMVGDRRHDVEAGHARSTRTVGVTWGFGSRQELEEARAEVVIDSPTELIGAIRDRL